MLEALQSGPRLRIALAWLLAIALLAGCSSGSSDGGEAGGELGSGSNTPPPPPNGDDPVRVLGLTASLAWASASGPVAGYRILVSRNDGPFTEELQSNMASAMVSGMPGDVISVRVAAFDAQGNSGPLSPPSDKFVLVGTQSAAAAAASEASSASAESATTVGSSARTVAAGSESSSAAPAAGEGDGSGEEIASSASAGDLHGDAADDLVWQSQDGTLVRVSNADLSDARLYTLPSAGWRVAAIGDFDADGLSDILFAAPGELALARGTALRAAPGALSLEAWAHLPAGAELAASGDFDGDGATDAAVVEASAVSLWLAAGDVLALPAAAPGSELTGAGDADGDGHDDLLWSGAEGFSLWRVVAGTVSDVTAVAAVAGARFAAFADFDGDGASELALHAAGVLTLARPLAAEDAVQEPAPSGALLAGCGDYDGDGSRDRLWVDADSLRVVTATGERVVALDPASPWRLFHSCN